MTRRFAFTVSAFLTLTLFASAVQARAQGFISPMLGVNFGGVSGCPQLNNCTNKQTNLSIAAGVFGTIIGVEAEVAYAPTFFGEAAGLSSNLVTLMGNVMLAPKAGPLRPYALAGVGLIKTHFELRTSSLLTTNDTSFGYGVGFGVFGFVTNHVGLRGDLRYFHSFRDFTLQGFTLGSAKLNYSRISAGVVVKF